MHVSVQKQNKTLTLQKRRKSGVELACNISWGVVCGVHTALGTSLSKHVIASNPESSRQGGVKSLTQYDKTISDHMKSVL